MGKEAGLVMIEKEKIDRINELAAIAKVRELTEEELDERTVLRRAYIDAIKGSLRVHLESIEIVDE